MALKSQRPSAHQHPNTGKLQALMATSGAKKRLNAEVEVKLYQRIRRRALDEDSTVSEITRRLWLAYLDGDINTFK